MLNDHVFPLESVIKAIEIALENKPPYEDSRTSLLEAIYSLSLEIKALQKSIERLETPDYD